MNLAIAKRRLSSLSQTLAIAPDDGQALMLLKLVVLGLPKAENSAGASAAATTPEDYLGLSLGHYRAGEFARCIEAAQKALDVRPGYDLAYNNICAAYNELRQWDRAIEAGEKAVLLNPDNQLARNNLAWSKAQKRAAGATGIQGAAQSTQP